MKGIAYLILTAILLSLVIFVWPHVDLRSSDHMDRDPCKFPKLPRCIDIEDFRNLPEVIPETITEDRLYLV
jgi:hypothetical protein